MSIFRPFLCQQFPQRCKRHQKLAFHPHTFASSLCFSNTKKASKKQQQYTNNFNEDVEDALNHSLSTYKFIDTSQHDKSYDSLNIIQLEAEYEKILHQFQTFTSKLLLQRLTPALIEHLKIDQVPLKQCATIFVKDPLQLIIKPFDPNHFKKIEKQLHLFLSGASAGSTTPSHTHSVQGSTNPLNLTLQSRPENNELSIIMPKWTTQSRDHVAKMATLEAEEFRKKLRIMRQAALEELKSWIVQKDHLFKAQELVQSSFEKFSKKIGDYLELKKKDIHKV
jgi:ribosome recycling factor